MKNKIYFPGLIKACVIGIALLSKGNLRAAVQSGIQINYSTTGSATYADGTPILEGERFLLVWFNTGVSIDLTKDISGDQDSFMGEDWWWVSYKASVDGRCPANTWSVPSSIAIYSKGRVQLYLLDTRISKTELAPMVKNSENYLFPSVINAVVPISGATYSWSAFDASPHTITGTAPATTAWTIVVRETPVPVIVSFSLASGVASVGATNTAATGSYVLKKASDATFTNVIWTSAAQTGASGLTVPLTFEDSAATDSAAFYRIETAK